MAKFELENNVETKFSVNKTTSAYLVDFDLPESVKERLPAEVVREINGEFCVSYYDTPQVGDRLIHKGHQWRVTERVIYVTRYRSRKERKRVPLLRVEYLGEV